MADNVSITAGAGTTVAADDIGGVLHQRIKVQHGADGSATDTSAAAPLPVTDATTLAAVDQVEAALAAILAKIIAAPATEAKQDTLISAVDGLEGKDYATQTTLAALLAKVIAAPATEAKQDTGNTSLASILAAVDGLEVNTAGLATQATLASILTELGQKLEPGGEVALDAATLSALETIGLDSATLTALETITVGTALPAGDNNIGNVDLASAIPAGTNNIGDVDVLTLPALPAGTNNIGDVDVVTLPNASSATLSNVNDSASSAQLVASNSSRKGLLIFNDSTVAMYVKYGATASVTDFTVKLAAAGYWEMPSPIYTGRVDGIWASDASGAARITEL